MTSNDFLSRYHDIRQSMPQSPTRSFGNENSELLSYTYRSSNCFNCFDCVECKNCSYCFDCVRCADCTDCSYCVDCELLYGCIDCYKAYNSAYLNYCGRTYDSFFCWDCADCHDIFGCTHLKHKQYCIFNQQYTKNEYQEKIAELLKLSPEENLSKLKVLIQKYPFGPTNITSSVNSDYGNHVHYCNNCYLCFDTARSQDCGYLYDSAYSQNSYDLSYCYKAELCYECVDCARVYNSNYLERCSDCFDCSYLTDCLDCHNCFGCVSLAHKKFCFLNKQYAEQEYLKLTEAIKPTVR